MMNIMQFYEAGKKHVPKTTILNVAFQNNFNNSASGLSIVAAGTTPGFVTGRKGTDYAVNFTGTVGLKTDGDLIINTRQISISFWIKTTQNATGIVIESGTAYNTFLTFAVLMRTGIKVEFADAINTSAHANQTQTSSLSNNWHHIVITSDRTKDGNNQTNIFVDKILDTTLISNYDPNNIYPTLPLFIGRRNGSVLGFVGLMQDLKMYNYIISNDDIINLYNE